jgi:CheY-like chemotaxis protein
VKDTGIGIRKDDLPKLFDVFEQFNDGQRHGIVGTGLGLTISKELVDMMDGRIEVKSQYGKGSVFTVLLPLAAGDPAQVEQQGLTSMIVADGRVNVLVVDDNSMNLKVMSAYLARHNIKADTAESGAEAIKKVQEKHYHLLCLDQMMPEMDGIEITARIRALQDEWCRTMPVIAFSANALTGMRELFFASGMNDFLSKPVNPDELNKMLKKWLPPDMISENAVSAKELKPQPAGQVPVYHDRKKKHSLPLDNSAGLANAAGNNSLYQQLLADFIPKHGGDMLELKGALERGDFKRAHLLAHTLKSTSALIGAKRLSAAAREAEIALGDEKHPLPLKLLNCLGAEFDALLAGLASAVPACRPKTQSAGDLDKSKALSLIEKLSPLLKSGDTDSLKLLDEIPAAFGSMGEECETLAEQINEFEFAEAAETLDAIRGKIEGAIQ